MDLVKVLAQLREELADLDAAILSLERFQQERPRRGRPPKWRSQANRPLSAESPAPPAADGRNRDTA